KRARCPQCGNPIEILAPEEIYEAEAAPLGGYSDYELEDRSAVNDDRRPCPICGEMIVHDAVKCRFCGEIFNPELKKQEQKRLNREALAEDGADMSTGDWVVAILCSGIGCIAGIVWMIQGKPKGKKMLLVSLAVQAFWVFVQVGLQLASTP